MKRFYPAQYYEERGGPDYIRRYEAQVRTLPDLNGRRVLDIGCARGDFLHFLEQRYPRMEGVGVDPFASSTVPGRFQFIQSFVENAHFPPASFDVVMAWAVIEHLPSPSQCFAEVRRILKPGGLFTFLVTNERSLHDRWALLEDVPRHLYHFSPKTVRRYAERFGFEVQRILFTDDIFDGRGRGAITRLLERWVGVTWAERFRGPTRPVVRWIRRLGGYADRIVFSTHWEARLGISGIMVVQWRRLGKETP
jgi:SAM-dependent methyltransferase